MLPTRGLPPFAEAPLVIMRENCPAIWTRDLLSKYRCCLAILQGCSQRTKPLPVCRRGVRIQEYPELAPGQLHPVIHHPAWIVILRPDLDKMLRVCRPQQVHGSIGGPG